MLDNMLKNSFLKIAFLFALCLLMLSCKDKLVSKVEVKDWKQIKQKGKLTVLTENSTLSFYELKGKKMGFEYEILDTFCKAHNLELEVKVIDKIEQFNHLLNKGEGDVVAANLPIELNRQKILSYSIPYYHTYQVLVQRKSDSVIKEPAHLASKTLYVDKHSAYEKRLVALQKEIGATLDVRYKRSLHLAEDLIEEVAKGRIRFTLAHENQARLAKETHPQLDIKTRMSFEQKIAFGFRPKSVELKKKMDTFLRSYTASEEFSQLKKKYFDYIENETIEIFLTPKGAISPFDELFKAAALKYNWDWKLLAAVAFRESRFNPHARGSKGAYGMMQFMPGTGPSFGVYPNSSPEVQINGGMKYLAYIGKRWNSIVDERARMQFVLASYNAGVGHIEDAQRLAKAAGLDPNMWENNVELMVTKLSEPEFYRSELVRCGAYRGHAPQYTTSVINLYDSWK